MAAARWRAHRKRSRPDRLGGEKRAGLAAEERGIANFIEFIGEGKRALALADVLQTSEHKAKGLGLGPIRLIRARAAHPIVRPNRQIPSAKIPTPSPPMARIRGQSTSSPTPLRKIPSPISR